MRRKGLQRFLAVHRTPIMRGKVLCSPWEGQRMNYTEFIRRTDKIIESMPPENLAAFLHDCARSVPECKREAFLERFISFSDQDVGWEEDSRMDTFDREQLKAAIKKNMERLEQINDEEVMLQEELNEEYDDWYDNGEEFFYEDPENICGDIEEGIRLVHECIDREMYQECYDLADFLLAMVICAEGDYGGIDFSLKDLAQQEIAAFDYEKFVLEALLSAYWGNDLEERPEALYWMFENADSEKATLELVMQKSPKELEFFQEFLGLWIGRLGNASGKTAERLLREAVSLAEGPDILLEAARKYVDNHPKLYLQALERCKADSRTKEGLEIGQEAVARIATDRQVRNQAALFTAEFALELQDQEEAERCWLEAFRSVRSGVNYLRLVLESREYEKRKKEAERIFTGVVSDNMPGSRPDPYHSRNTYFTLLFFNGNFRQMIEGGMRVKQALGWSSTFMKEGMALLFLYFYQGESLLAGCNSMCKRVLSAIQFDKESYLKGTGKSTDLEEQQFFWQQFLKWRQHVQIPEEEAAKIIGKLETWVELRVAGIMENNRRNYYGECAAFAAALGEVKESRGEPDAKNRTLEAYRSKYSRRSAFHQELRGFGMRDVRKRK